MVCRCEPLHSSGYGHMADGIRPDQAVHRTAGSTVVMVHPVAGQAHLTGEDHRLYPDLGPRRRRQEVRYERHLWPAANRTAQAGGRSTTRSPTRSS